MLNSFPVCVTRSPRSYNSQIGVPLSVWLMNEQTEVGVFEPNVSTAITFMPAIAVTSTTI